MDFDVHATVRQLVNFISGKRDSTPSAEARLTLEAWLTVAMYSSALSLKHAVKLLLPSILWRLSDNPFTSRMVPGAATTRSMDQVSMPLSRRTTS